MTPPRDAAANLLNKARGDERAYRRLMEDQDMPVWLLGFHAQQAVEKAVKAVLSMMSIEYPRTHNLTMLVGLLSRHGMKQPPDAEEVARLTPFGAVLRYDDALEDKDLEFDREWAMKCVERTVCWAGTILDDQR